MRVTREELERLRRDRAVVEPRAQRGCPDAETLRQAAARGLDLRAAGALADHLLACPDCAAELQLLGELQAWSEEVASPRNARRATDRRIRGAPPWAWAAAAALAVAIGATYLLVPPGGPRVEPAKERGAPAATSASEPSDGASLAAAPSRLAWTAVAGAEAYEVTLLDAESSLLWTSPPVAEPVVELPAAVRERLQAGQVYYWRVTAQVGPERRRLPVREFTIRW